MPSERKFYKTVLRVTVLSEGRFKWESLVDVGYQITTGDCYGSVQEEVNEEITAQEVAKGLLEQGSDPEFFLLTEDGEDVEGF